MFFLGYGWQRRLQKTHDRCQPWVLVKFAVQQAPTASLTTTTTGKVTTCELNLNITKKIIVPLRRVKPESPGKNRSQIFVTSRFRLI